MQDFPVHPAALPSALDVTSYHFKFLTFSAAFITASLACGVTSCEKSSVDRPIARTQTHESFVLADETNVRVGRQGLYASSDNRPVQRSRQEESAANPRTLRWRECRWAHTLANSLPENSFSLVGAREIDLPLVRRQSCCRLRLPRPTASE
jgi:hypothetical protein